MHPGSGDIITESTNWGFILGNIRSVCCAQWIEAGAVLKRREPEKMLNMWRGKVRAADFIYFIFHIQVPYV